MKIKRYFPENTKTTSGRKNDGVDVHLYAASPSATMTGSSFSPSLEMSRTRNLGRFTINLRFTSDMHFFMSSYASSSVISDGNNKPSGKVG